MELNELKEKALLLKQENIKLHKEVKVKENEYAGIIKKNFVEIVLPYMNKMNDFVKNLSCRSFENALYLIDTNQIQVRLRVSDFGIGIDFKEWKSYGLDTYINWKDSYKKLYNENWFQLAEYFDSVDACNKFLGKLNENYALILTKAIEGFETENPALAETLQNLTERIRNSSFVEQKEDGSVEITINGKTYIGTVKEA